LEQTEREQLGANIVQMQLDVWLHYHEIVESTNHGAPDIVHTIRTGDQGRPRMVIDPGWLRWAYATRSTSAIAHYLGLSRSFVHLQLLKHGIAQPGSDPFPLDEDEQADGDSLLDPAPTGQPAPSNGPHTSISDDDLDGLIRNLGSQFQRAGVRLICWGIVIHGFVNGYSCLITGLRASNNNRGQTV
ncbi:hypothetical protein C8J56DRAFT_801001, partial [Mycena floridula]